MSRLLGIGLISLFVAASLAGQDEPRQSPSLVTNEMLRPTRERLEKLGRAIDVMVRQGVRDPMLADVEIYRKAVDWALRHEEIKDQAAVHRLESVVDRGLLRAAQVLRGESPWFFQVGQTGPRGYRSRVDGSLQPYAVTYPPDYGRDPRVRWRLDVVLHGRDTSLNEVKFLSEHSGDTPPKAGSSQVVLHVFGRGNLGYRWAAETDVWEAIDHFVAVERSLGRDWLDPRRVVLKGFSMGGAGAWHLGLHRPDRWAAVAPGAGFVTTRGYVKNLPEPLPEFVEKCLTIYDSVEYAANTWNVPIVAFAGQNDPQNEAVRLMQERLRNLNCRFNAFIAPGIGHTFPVEWQNKVEQQISQWLTTDQGPSDYPERILFHTFTLKYPGCYWVEILGMERHYQRAEVDASYGEKGFHVTTKNVRTLRLSLPGVDDGPQQIQIDGQSLTVRPVPSALGRSAVYLQKSQSRWGSTLPQRLTTSRLRRLQKFSGLTGPIDDAFTDSFICVRGTEQPWHPEVGKLIDRRLDEFRRLWSRYFRGELPVKNDDEITDEDIATRHLILFGDPSSNRLVAHILEDLPLQWTKESLSLEGKSFDARNYLPVLIYPSPLNPARYVVLNSGHTFGESDLAGSNALLYPRLGDYAVLRVDDKIGTVSHAGLFDDFWSFFALREKKCAEQGGSPR
jgi:pimeloyl-ACP methyl ester carboxylesterase